MINKPTSTTDLAAGYLLNDGSGSTASDQLGVNPGTLVNSPTWISDDVGNGLSFNGTDQYVDTGTSLLGSGSFSVELYLSYTPHGEWHDMAGDDDWQLFVDSFAGGNSLGFRGGGNVGGNSTDYLVSTGDHHVVLTYDSDTTTVTIYLDGKLSSTGTVSVGTSGNFCFARSTFYFAADPWADNIYFVRVYDVAMTAYDVAVEYAAVMGIAPTFDSALVPSTGSEVDVLCTVPGTPPMTITDGTGFTVLVNGTARTITAATASSDTIVLATTGTIYSTDTVTVAYDGSGNAQDSAGNPLATFSAESVTNDSSQAPLPTFSSATVPSAGTSVVVNLIVPGTPPILPSSGVTGFTVLVNGTSRSITEATAASDAVTLTTSGTIYILDTVTVSYTPGNATDSASFALASFSAQSVANDSTQVLTGTWYVKTVDGYTPWYGI